MLILKFGGSSIESASRIEKIKDIIAQRLSEKPIVVFSAMGKTTDNLLEAGEAALLGEIQREKIENYHLEIMQGLGVNLEVTESLFEELGELLKGISLLKELSPRTRDYLVSFGERCSVRIISAYLSQCGIPAKSFDAWELGMLTNSRFNEAEILEETYQRISESMTPFVSNYTFTPIVTGYIAHDREGRITTLGRGGSDLTASVIGAALDADEIQVWKDVNGILTTDPQIVETARPVPHVSFEEASELAYFGAKILHPLSIQPAMRKGIPVRVKNSYNPEHPGSVIVGARDENPTSLVKAITCKRKVTLIDIVSTRMLGQYGFLAKVFQIFNEHQVSVDMVATSEVSVSLTIDGEAELQGIAEELEAFSRVRIGKRKAILSIVGDVKRSSEILDTAFGILKEANVNVQMISQGASKVNIALIVEDDEVEPCMKLLHYHFFEAGEDGQ